MGVPSFYRWLVSKYPKVVSDAHEDGGGAGFDNLYLDMNGIIHSCFHPEDEIFPPTSFSEVFSRIPESIDRLFNIVKPQKLLFLAIDGVAPRAKMNQQRARRFRASKDNQMAQEMEDKLRQQYVKEGKILLPKEESELTDSNIITPGTEFMQLLSESLQNYIRTRMSEYTAWRSIKVILSDDKVPGEGEHKIMSFIRAQRSLPGYDPNTRHCLYGLDADLIMLALATHEVHFSILREEVLSPVNQYTQSTKQDDRFSKLDSDKGVQKINKKQNYQFLNVSVLRDYLALDMNVVCENKDFDLERIIDDFIFICFFAGNDFLPHMPSLGIHEGCMDLLMQVYREEFKNLGGHIVDIQRVDDKKGGFIKLKRAERFILAVGSYEEKIFQKRSDMRDRALKRALSDYSHYKEDEKIALEEGKSSDIVCTSELFSQQQSCIEGSSADEDVEVAYNNTMVLKQQLKDSLKNQADLFKDGVTGTDKVKFGKEGWKERYYQVKFNADSPDEIEAVRKSVVLKYGEGLCWVLLYYFSGVPSWTWFYPYHHSPLASDCKGLSQTKLKFDKGLPFKPFDQLMGVLPPSSAQALPVAYRSLMTDQNSGIIDFYPMDFEIDLDGKRFSWQGLCMLPFIDEGRLLAETMKFENKLKDHERVRNSETMDKLFMLCTSSLSNQFGLISCEANLRQLRAQERLKALCSDHDGIKGTIHLKPADLADTSDSMDKRAKEDVVMCFAYETYQKSKFIPRLLEGVNIPEKIVDAEELQEPVLWHDFRGSNRDYMNRNSAQIPRHTTQNCSYVPGSVGSGRGFGQGRGKPQLQLDQRNHPGGGGTNSSHSVVYIPPKAGYNEAGGSGSGKRCPPYVPPVLRHNGRSVHPLPRMDSLTLSETNTRQQQHFVPTSKPNNNSTWQRQCYGRSSNAWRENHVPTRQESSLDRREKSAGSSVLQNDHKGSRGWIIDPKKV